LKISKYINGTSALQAFQLIRFGTLLLISILFTKNGLSVSDIGSYETVMLISGAISFFWITGLIQSFLALFRNNQSIHDIKNGSRSPEIFNLFFMVTIFSIASCLFIILFRNFLTNNINNGVAIPFFNLMVIYIFLSNPAFLIEYIYLALQHYKKMIIYGIITYFIQLLLVCLPLFSGFGIVYCLYGLLAVTVIRICWLITLVFKYSSIKISFRLINEYFKFGLPLIVTALLCNSQQYIAGFIVTSKFDAATLAIFRFGARDLPLVVLITSAFSNSLLPEFGRNNISDVLKKIKDKSLKMIYYLFPLAVISLLVSKSLFPVIFNSNFAASAGIFNIFILLVVSRLVFPQTIALGLKKTRIIFWVSAAEVIINTLLALLLINFIGLMGVGFAFVIASYSEKAIQILYLSRKQKVKISEYIPLKQFLVGSVLIFVSFVISIYIK
jgi:O-antigen/teichoic acid export membrane protein